MADPYRSNGSAAYDVRRRNTAQPLEQPERLPDAPARRKPARHVRARLGISPLTALGAAAAVLMLALVVFSYIRLYEARSDVGKLQTQLSTLEEQQARLQSQYDNALDLEQIEKRAKELGMRQPGSSQIILTGNLAGAPRYSHENHGRRFYAFPLEVERLSGTTDTLPVLAPLELLEQTPAAGGDTLCVTGQIRSYNNREPEGRRLVISVLAETMTLCSAAHDNRAELLGTICRAPVYRRTPLGREICDVMLAVNRPYRRADYLPCILWGRTAQEAAELPVGTQLALTGRLQSREYIKMLGTTAERRTAYEISAILAEPVRE